jgi:hypothetical protein
MEDGSVGIPVSSYIRTCTFCKLISPSNPHRVNGENTRKKEKIPAELRIGTHEGIYPNNMMSVYEA